MARQTEPLTQGVLAFHSLTTFAIRTEGVEETSRKCLTFQPQFDRIITMIKIKNGVPFIHFRQARIDMTLANGDKLGTYQTLPYQKTAPTKGQWFAQVADVWDVTDITFRDFGVQSAQAPKGHPAWNLVGKSA